MFASFGALDERIRPSQIAGALLVQSCLVTLQLDVGGKLVEPAMIKSLDRCCSHVVIDCVRAVVRRNLQYDGTYNKDSV